MSLLGNRVVTLRHRTAVEVRTEKEGPLTWALQGNKPFYVTTTREGNGIC